MNTNYIVLIFEKLKDIYELDTVAFSGPDVVKLLMKVIKNQKKLIVDFVVDYIETWKTNIVGYACGYRKFLPPANQKDLLPAFEYLKKDFWEMHPKYKPYQSMILQNEILVPFNAYMFKIEMFRLLLLEIISISLPEEESKNTEQKPK